MAGRKTLTLAIKVRILAMSAIETRITNQIRRNDMKRKRKELPKERNVFVAAAMFRKAGAHAKTTKAIRRMEKQGLARDINKGDHDGGPCSSPIYLSDVI